MRRRRRLEAESTLSVTSMMDMFTILLIYLLYFFDPNNDPSQNLLLAASSATEQGEQPEALVVTPEAVLLGSRKLATGTSPEELRAVFEALQAQHQGTNPTSDLLIVKCDKRTLYEQLDLFLREAGRAGYTDFRFVVLAEAG